MSRRLLSLAAVACAAALAAGCGGGTTKTEASSWASGYCSDSTELLVFLVDVRDGTKGGFVAPKDGAKVIDFRTGIYHDEIGKLGEPDTAPGSSSRDVAKEYVKTAQEHADNASSAAADSAKSSAEQKYAVEDEANGSLVAMKAATAKLQQQDADLRMATNPDCAELQSEFAKHLTG